MDCAEVNGGHNPAAATGAAQANAIIGIRSNNAVLSFSRNRRIPACRKRA